MLGIAFFQIYFQAPSLASSPSDGTQRQDRGYQKEVIEVLEKVVAGASRRSSESTSIGRKPNST